MLPSKYSCSHCFHCCTTQSLLNWAGSTDVLSGTKKNKPPLRASEGRCGPYISLTSNENSVSQANYRQFKDRSPTHEPTCRTFPRYENLDLRVIQAKHSLQIVSVLRCNQFIWDMWSPIPYGIEQIMQENTSGNHSIAAGRIADYRQPRESRYDQSTSCRQTRG